MREISLVEVLNTAVAHHKPLNEAFESIKQKLIKDFEAELEEQFQGFKKKLVSEIVELAKEMK